MSRSVLIIFLAFHLNCYLQLVVRENRLLWEISGNGLPHKSYLFGSLHSNDKRVFNFSDSTYVALEKSTIIVLETDLFSLFPHWDTRLEEPGILFDNSGKPYTGDDQATKTIYGDENGMPQFMDAFFQQYCYNAGKTFFKLEDPSDQLRTMKRWIENDKAIFYSDQSQDQELFVDLYLKGDISEIDKLMRQNLAANTGMYEDIIISRNKKMAQKLDSIVRMSPTFCAVGAGHLAGELGLINLLRSKGFRLRPIVASYSEPSVSAKKIIRSQGSYTYYHSPSRLLAIFPGKPTEIPNPESDISLIYRDLGQGNTYTIDVFSLKSSSNEQITLREQAMSMITGPDETSFECKTLDNGLDICEGIGNAYPEGYHWIRLIQSDAYLIVMKAFGGNKFMNSNRPHSFFDKVGFE